MKESDIMIEIENLSLYFSSLEQQVKNMNEELKKITNLLNSLREHYEKRSNDS